MKVLEELIQQGFTAQAIKLQPEQSEAQELWPSHESVVLKLTSPTGIKFLRADWELDGWCFQQKENESDFESHFGNLTLEVAEATFSPVNENALHDMWTALSREQNKEQNKEE